MEEKETVTQRERLEQQLRFIVEVDKVKNIFRQTYLADGQRKENDAEHSVASGFVGSAFKGAYERGRRSDKGDDHGADSRSGRD